MHFFNKTIKYDGGGEESKLFGKSNIDADL